MIMKTSKLNLARKWRSRNFDEIIGQELSIKILKNSLYLSQYFPVYLFSGQRGCGKTSTARIFAAATNCSELDKFRKNPKKCSIPCLECESCLAMISAKHPDFIEIDAASHTGVDNVRQIIETSSFLPVMGRKKIYLIDEAHMLSKAAFNAFLKILEEPPPSVLFIFATTNPQRIIDTVRSRCFQLFFRPVSYFPLIDHLKNICKKEKVKYDDNGLSLIIRESKGSVRDAINLLEQVRFSSSFISKESVQNVLGHLDEDSLINIFDLLIKGESKSLLLFLKDLKADLYSSEFIWERLTELLRSALWLKHGVEPNWYIENIDKLKKLVKCCSWNNLLNIVSQFYENENLFRKTTSKYSLLEMILIQICKKNDVSDQSGASSMPEKVAPVDDQDLDDDFDDEQENDDDIIEDDSKKAKEVKFGQKEWGTFLSLLDSFGDPFISSIFKNGQFVSFDSDTGKLNIEFMKKFSFFKDSIDETKDIWYPILIESYSKEVLFAPCFTKNCEVEKMSKREVPTYFDNSRNVNKKQEDKSFNNKITRSFKPSYNKVVKSNNYKFREKVIDVSDVSAWKKANVLLKYFSGKICEVQES